MTDDAWRYQPRHPRGSSEGGRWAERLSGRISILMARTQQIEDLPPPSRGYVRMFHGSLRLRGEPTPGARGVASSVEQMLGLPTGSIYNHAAFRSQREDRAADPNYYVAPRRDAEGYARMGGEVLFDALSAAYYVRHGGGPSSGGLVSDEARDFARQHIARLGTPQLAVVDVPHAILRWWGQDPFLLDQWPDEGDYEAWESQAAMMSEPAGIAIPPEYRGELIEHGEFLL